MRRPGGSGAGGSYDLSMRAEGRRRLGGVLIGAGLALVLVGVLYLLEAASGGRRPRSFAERRSYDQVKVDLHAAFPAAAALAAAGLTLALGGARLRRGALTEGDRYTPGSSP